MHSTILTIARMLLVGSSERFKVSSLWSLMACIIHGLLSSAETGQQSLYIAMSLHAVTPPAQLPGTFVLGASHRHDFDIPSTIHNRIVSRN
jgi:hypothetical protein